MNRVRFTIKLLFIILSTFLYADLTEDFLFISSLYKDGYYDIALREIAKIESKLADDQFANQILSLKADILIKQGNSIEAKRLLDRLYALPLSIEIKKQVSLNRAIVERDLGNNNEAYLLIKDYLTRFSDLDDNVEAQQLLGDLYLERLLFQEAENMYMNLHINKKTEQSYINLIRLYSEMNNISEAEKLLEDLKIDFPREYSAHQQGLLYILRGYENKGSYAKIIELFPEELVIKTTFTEDLLLIKIISLINLKNFNEAQNLLEEIKKDTLSADYYRAMIHKEKGENHQALMLFKRLYQSSSATSEIKVMSFFNTVQITALNNTTEANDLLLNYLLENPDQEWEGDILYQLAFMEYQKDNYEVAYDYVKRSLNLHLNNINRQKALYLRGELEFLKGDYESSLNTFLENQQNMPEAFRDEALFKLAICSFFLGKPDIASRFFTQLIMNYPGSSKLGVAYFYLGEIELHRNINYARSYYQQAFSGNMDEGAIRLRIAYIDYMKREYDLANTMLDLVPDTNDYMYDKYLLKGNIFFAQKNYTAALEAYRIAERNAQDQTSVEYIWSRQAWTHYNLKNYDTATHIYQRLAEQSVTPGRYVLSAASAAFNAEQYEQATELYIEYIDTYPDSPDINRARSGLANSYFNMGLYIAAIEEWMILVHEDNNANIVQSALKGIQTGYQRLSRVNEFIEFLNLTRLRFVKKDFIINLYEYKAQFEYEQKNYTSSIATINQLIREYPEKGQDQKVMILLANNYSWLMQYNEADNIYLELARRNDDPHIYYEWGNIRWAQRDYDAAMTRYRRAADNSTNELYWTTLLDRMVERQDADFLKYYNEFTRFASPYHGYLIMLNLIDWLQYTREYNRALDVADEILESGFPQLRPRATFKKAETLFFQKKYDDALKDFLRIRYIFPEMSDLHLASEVYITKIYVEQNDKQRARNQFENIRSKLKPEQIADLEALIK